LADTFLTLAPLVFSAIQAGALGFLSDINPLEDPTPS